MTADALDGWLTGQLASLNSALDDVLDLNRGLADAKLPQVLDGLVVALDDVLDLDAGLTRILPLPAVGLPVQPTGEFSVFADDLAGLPAEARLAVRTWMSTDLLAAAKELTVVVLRAHALAGYVSRPEEFARLRNIAVLEAQGIVADFEPDDPPGRALQLDTVEFVHTLKRAPGYNSRVALHAHSLAERFSRALSVLLFNVSRHTRDDTRTAPFEHGFLSAVHTLDLHDIAALTSLHRALSRMLNALTSMVGADLTSADLQGVPLVGVRWSTSTRWPSDWRGWVRDNSAEVLPGVFEIQRGRIDVDSLSRVTT
ncbi:hypothetical protein ABZ345_11685 [Lentzea sp. NPDC005914]|uniref:hypothetical protein n=1 Tax=Lentzea sp. NPDC005914 TaxID=3154572 RepID=UPI00340AAD85